MFCSINPIDYNLSGTWSSLVHNGFFLQGFQPVPEKKQFTSCILGYCNSPSMDEHLASRGSLFMAGSNLSSSLLQ